MNINETAVNSATYNEITTQTKAWAGALTAVSQQAGALQKLWQAGRFDNVLFTGCGSTYYLSLAAAASWQALLDVPTKAVPGGELYLAPAASYRPAPNGRNLLVAISRSGATSETVAAVKKYQADGLGAVIVICNYGVSELAQMGDVNIIIPEGQEESVAQTRSFASMYVAMAATAVTLAQREDLLAEMGKLPAIGEKLITKYESLAQKIGQNLDFDRFYFLGSGSRYGLACEVNLKMKEMTLTHSEPFHFFEFRHGPMSMVNDSALVVGLISDENKAHETAVLHEMAQLGGHTLALGDSEGDVVFDSRLPAVIRNVLYLPVLQLMAYFRALVKGLNPDRPNNLTAVIGLKLE